ncbi:AMP-binding protein [Leucobacter sp. M11]|uniref:AMP-binding protein n=1 Tax=Leucobacter sp. M11 TaxID=2993565 RepID=UPI002D7E898B|nr:AMP-binding protein [Leucobacter sp. M11]
MPEFLSLLGSEPARARVDDSPLSPLAFLHRSSLVFPEKVALEYEGTTWTYRQFRREVEDRAALFRQIGVTAGDRVAYMMPNLPEMLFAHYAVPLVGAVLVPINTRLGQDEVQYILNHSGSSVLVADAEYSSVIAPIRATLSSVHTVYVCEDEHAAATATGISWGERLHEAIAAGVEGDRSFRWSPDDERRPISINYTSGTTGKPKGVVYTHRGAYLNALAEVLHSRFTAESVYLWTLPMFHCNGWCTTWALVAVGGRQVCLRAVRGDRIWGLIDACGVTHLNGAPPVVTTIRDSNRAHELSAPIVITSGGAPISPTVLQEMESLGFLMLHIYGLTETYGPISVCEPQDRWAELSPGDLAAVRSRQGVQMIPADRLRVVTGTARKTQTSSMSRPTVRRLARLSCAETPS